MGDCVLSTVALCAIRKHFPNAKITFLANPVARQWLPPTDLCDDWLEPASANPFEIAKMLKKEQFSLAVLFKNSFGSALSVFMAKIPRRLGYARDLRSLFLN